MHELFTKVLSKRDLSKAGELFFVSDSEIVDDLSSVVSIINILLILTIKWINIVTLLIVD